MIDDCMLPVQEATAETWPRQQLMPTLLWCQHYFDSQHNFGANTTLVSSRLWCQHYFDANTTSVPTLLWMAWRLTHQAQVRNAPSSGRMLQMPPSDCVRACVRACAPARICVCACVHVHARVRMSAGECVQTCICVHACVRASSQTAHHP